MGRKAREFVREKYAWEIVGERLLGLYESQLAQPRAK
jgi:hypothetical protein